MSSPDSFKIKVVIDTSADLAGASATKKALEDVGRAGDDAAKKVGTGFGKSNQVLTDMGRIVSDMPYGIQGIGNNIMPLVESFGRAKEAAGGTGAAIKSVLAGLVGPMGLAMVGIPIVTSLAIAFGGKLAGAIGESGKKVDDLEGQLKGIQQYKDFSLAIKIAGLEGVKKLSLELDMLKAKRDYLMGVISADELVKKTKEAEHAGFFVAPWDSGEKVNKAHEAVAAAENARNAIDRKAAKDILAGKFSFGQTEDVRLLTTYMGMSQDKALGTLAKIQVGFEIDSKKSEIGKQQKKDDEKSAKARESAADKARSEAEALANARDAWRKALGKSDPLPTVDEATKKVMKVIAGGNKADAAGNTDDLNKYAKSLSDAQEVLKKVTDENTAWVEMQNTINDLLGKSESTSISYVEALARETEAKENLRHQESLGEGNKEGQLRAIKEYNAAHEVTGKVLAASVKKMEGFKEALAGIGQIAALFGLNSSGATGVLTGISQLNDPAVMADLAKKYGSGDAAKNAVYAQIAQGAGQLIGGGVGGALSNTASGALTGSMLATTLGLASGGVGALIGGGLSLIGSLFDGGASAQDVSTAEGKASASAQTLDQLAAAGNPVARAIMARNGYSATNVAVSGRMSSAMGLGVDQYLGTGARDFGLFYTKENGYNQGLLDYLSTMTKIDTAIQSFASSSVLRNIEQINWKYKELAATSGLLADTEKARLAELTVAVTGVSADSIGAMIADAVNADATGSAGAAFAKKFEDSIAEAIRNLAISNLVNTAIMPVLQPVMASLVSGLVSGSLSTADMAGMLSGVKTVTAQIAPLVESLASAFTLAGVGPNGASVAYDALNPLMIEHRAGGGPVIAGRSYIVGENRPELFTPSMSGTITPYVPSGSGANAEMFLRELKAILSEPQGVTVTIDGQEFAAWMEKKRVQTETRIANGFSRVTTQVF